MKVLVLGAKGNLGQELVRAFAEAGHEVVGTDQGTLDATNEAAVVSVLDEGKFGCVLNAVAYNNVDGAEDPVNQALCWRLNAEVPGMLARLAKDRGIVIVHYSTDYVFAGTRPEGYVETDVPDAISEYGRSKAAGEKAVLDTGGEHYVVRTSRIFGPAGISEVSKPSFVAMMMKLAKTEPELSIVNEEVGCPTYTRDLSRATVALVEDYDPGVYHLVNEGPGVNWLEFAEAIFAASGITTPRKGVPSSAFPVKAKRPAYAALLNTLGPKLRPRDQAIRDFLKEYPDGR